MSETFNLSGEALRKLLVFFVKVENVWEAQGYKTEDASVEFNPDSTTVTDVLGDTYTDLNKFQESITFEPNTLRRPQGAATQLNEVLHKYWRNDEKEKFSQFECAIVYGYLGTEGAYEADIWKACTIYPNSLGGTSRVDFPFTVNLGGEKVKAVSNGLRTGATIAESV